MRPYLLFQRGETVETPPQSASTVATASKTTSTVETLVP
jgi:hypothetical protein